MKYFSERLMNWCTLNPIFNGPCHICGRPNRKKKYTIKHYLSSIRNHHYDCFKTLKQIKKHQLMKFDEYDNWVTQSSALVSKAIMFGELRFIKYLFLIGCLDMYKFPKCKGSDYIYLLENITKYRQLECVVYLQQKNLIECEWYLIRLLKQSLFKYYVKKVIRIIKLLKLIRPYIQIINCNPDSRPYMYRQYEKYKSIGFLKDY